MNVEGQEQRLARKSHHVRLLHKHWEQLEAVCRDAYHGKGRCVVRLQESELEKDVLHTFSIEHYTTNIDDGPPIMIALQSYDPLSEIVVMIDYGAIHPAVYIVPERDDPSENAPSLG